MKYILTVFIMCITVFADTTEVIIGTPYIGNYIPFWGQSYDACRFQVLFLQSEINTEGRIIKFAFQPSTSATGVYNNFRLYFCHTNVSQLSSTFDDNYSGNTPELLIDSASFTVSGIANQWLEWPLSFNYDNTSNLLVEIRWLTDNNVGVPMWRTNESIPRRVYNMLDDNATTGTTQNTSNYVKLTIERPGGVKEDEGIKKDQKVVVMTPNIVRPGGKVKFILPESQEPLIINVYNLSGKLVRTFSSENSRICFWDLKDDKGSFIPAGVYFVRHDFGTGKIIIIY